MVGQCFNMDGGWLKRFRNAMVLNRCLVLLRLAAGLHLLELDRNYLECWNLHEKKEAEVFHLHTPKVAGCSVVHDLSEMVGRENIFSDEVCFFVFLSGDLQQHGGHGEGSEGSRLLDVSVLPYGS